MIIGPIQKIHSNDNVIVQVPVEYGDKNNLLWYEFDGKIEPYITTEKHDGFLVGLLLLGMKLGEDVHVQGNISAKLFYNLTQYYMDIVQAVIPEFHKVQITADKLVDDNGYKKGHGVITGFSAGIDSFSLIHDHLDPDIPDEYKVTHFLYNNVGSHGEWESEKANELFNKRYELIKGFSSEVSIPFIKINSNLSDVLQMDFQQTHTPRNVSSVLLLQGLIGKYLYASTYQYKDCYIGKAYDMAYADPFALHLLSTESLECISAGSQYSRIEKTRLITDYSPAQSWLNVCGSTRGRADNCSVCWKCNRTLFTLELLGKLDAFSDVFNLERWNWSRKWFIPETILNKKVKSPLIEEIRDLAKQQNYTFSLRDRVLHLIIQILPTRVYKYLRKIP